MCTSTALSLEEKVENREWNLSFKVKLVEPVLFTLCEMKLLQGQWCCSRDSFLGARQFESAVKCEL